MDKVLMIDLYKLNPNEKNHKIDEAKSVSQRKHNDGKSSTISEVIKR